MRINKVAAYCAITIFVFSVLYVTFICIVNAKTGLQKYDLISPAYNYPGSPELNRPEIKIGECTIDIKPDYFPFILKSYYFIYELNSSAKIHLLYSKKSLADRSCNMNENFISHNIYDHEFYFRHPANSKIRLFYSLPAGGNDGKVEPYGFVSSERGYYEIIRPVQ